VKDIVLIVGVVTKEGIRINDNFFAKAGSVVK